MGSTGASNIVQLNLYDLAVVDRVAQAALSSRLLHVARFIHQAHVFSLFQMRRGARSRDMSSQLM